MLNFEIWEAYYQYNKTHLLPIHWESGYQLTPEERALVTTSLQQFQRGESSEAKNLVRNAQLFLKDKEDQSYYRALLLFISEEHRHARDLKRFMQQQQIPPIGRHWVDGVFRWMRRRVKLEGSVVILLTAEIIAAVYYHALRDATKAPVLQQLCRQILRDEDQHIAFQAALLKYFYQQRSWWSNQWVAAVWRMLLVGTIVVVWNDHRKVLKAGGFRFASFWRSTWKQYRKARALMKEKVVIPEVAVSGSWG